MAIGAVSLAVAKASAMLGNKPLYLRIASLKHQQVSTYHTAFQGALSVSAQTNRSWSPLPLSALLQEPPATLTVPLLMVSLVSCGKSSPGKLNLMKEVICIPHPGLTAKQVPYMISNDFF